MLSARASTTASSLTTSWSFVGWRRREGDTIEGWLAYGAALNAGRLLFKSDELFGQWIEANSLKQLVGANGVKRDVFDLERSAAMWATAYPEQFEEARAAGGAGDHMRAAPETKISKLRALWGAGDRAGALRIAARFHDRSPETVAFKRGADAMNNPA